MNCFLFTMMSFVFRNVVNEVDNDTIVIVIGDHGMTETGMFLFLVDFTVFTLVLYM